MWISVLKHTEVHSTSIPRSVLYTRIKILVWSTRFCGFNHLDNPVQYSTQGHPDPNSDRQKIGTIHYARTVSLVTSLLVIRGLKKECDYGYPIGKKHSGVLPYFENINW